MSLPTHYMPQDPIWKKKKGKDKFNSHSDRTFYVLCKIPHCYTPTEQWSSVNRKPFGQGKGILDGREWSLANDSSVWYPGGTVRPWLSPVPTTWNRERSGIMEFIPGKIICCLSSWDWPSSIYSLCPAYFKKDLQMLIGEDHDVNTTDQNLKI
jgi:hypothetical protein